MERSVAYKLKITLIYAVIVISFIPSFHINILQAYFNPAFPEFGSHEKPTEGGFVKNAYLITSDPILLFNKKVNIVSFWKMVSPVWKETRYVEWFMNGENGTWELVETPNLSPTYREERGMARRWIWDFKQGRFEGNLAHLEYYRRLYANYLCKELSETGEQPDRLTARSVRKAIPPPAHAEGWSTVDAPVSRTIRYEVFPCP